jgi:hypothetical protein
MKHWKGTLVTRDDGPYLMIGERQYNLVLPDQHPDYWVWIDKGTIVDVYGEMRDAKTEDTIWVTTITQGTT